MPDRTPRRGGRWQDHRRIINGVLWRTRTGAPWQRVLDELRRGCDEAEGADWTVAVDSLTAKAHQHAAGAPRTPPVLAHTGGFPKHVS